MAEGGFPKSDGDILYASEVNGLFKILASDETGGTTDSTSYAKIGSCSVAASKCSAIIVMVNTTYRTYSSASDSYASTYDVRIGETGSVVSKREFKSLTPLNGGDYSNGVSMGSLQYAYEPTTDEITNGFDIEIYAKVTHGPIIAKVDSVYIIGN